MNNKKTLAMIHGVSWYDKSVIQPFAHEFAKANPDVRTVNIMDDSLLGDSLANGGPPPAAVRRVALYGLAAEAAGADVILCSCTAMAPATRAARQMLRVPMFNIDEPMARAAVQFGPRVGIVATESAGVPATRALLEYEAALAGKQIGLRTVIVERAFERLLAGDIGAHDEMVHGEIDKLAAEVDVVVLGQISLAQIRREAGVPVLQVGHSAFEEARRLLDLCE